MSSSIDRFLNQVREAESKQQREIVLSLMQARDLHSELTRLLLRLESLSAAAGTNQVISVELNGKDF